MQKKFIALAVAAALVPAAAMADTTVYGRIHLSLDSVSGSPQTNSLFLNSNSSRFGVKGSEDLGGGLKALYQLESGVNAAGGGGAVSDGNGPTTAHAGVFTAARDMYVGVAGDFGAVLAGRLGGSNQYVYDSNLFADQIGDAGTFTATLPGRLNSVLAYATPNMSGFDALVAFVPGSSLSSPDNSYTLKLNYSGMGFGAHLFTSKAVVGSATKKTIKPLAIAGSYDFGPGMVTAQYVKAKADTNGVTDTDRTIYNIGGSFNVSSNGAVKAQYSKAGDNNSVANTGGSMFAIGYDHNLSKRTGLYVAYAAVTNDSGSDFAVDNYGHGGNSALVGGDDPKAISVGLTHNF